MKRIWLVVALLVVGLGLIAACAQPAPKETAAPAAPAAAPTAVAFDAKKLYDASCAVCHGPDRQGISGIGKTLTPASLAQLSDVEIRNIISKGKPNTAMAGFEGRLSAEEINSLIQLIKYSSP